MPAAAWAWRAGVVRLDPRIGRDRRSDPEQLAGTFSRPGTPAVAGSTSTGADDGSKVVTIRWTNGTAVADVRLVVVAEGGGKVCGTAG